MGHLPFRFELSKEIFILPILFEIILLSVEIEKNGLGSIIKGVEKISKKKYGGKGPSAEDGKVML